MSNAGNIFISIITNSPGSGGDEASFGTSQSELEELENAIGARLNVQVREFFLQCLPSCTVDPGYVEFLPIADMLKENISALPGKLTSRHGMVVFGCSGDGGRYAVDAMSGSVALIAIGTVQERGIVTYGDPPYVPTTKETIFENAEQEWPDLKSFMLWLKAQVG